MTACLGDALVASSPDLHGECKGPIQTSMKYPRSFESGTWKEFRPDSATLNLLEEVQNRSMQHAELWLPSS